MGPIMFSKQSSLFSLVAVVFINLYPAIANADLVTFELDNVFTDRGGQMTGQFTWTYTPGDFQMELGNSHR